MMRLRWTRTVLCALGFVWVMLAWHLREHRELAEREQLIAEISRYCAEEAATTGSAASALQQKECELMSRMELVGGGARVKGSVDVSGSVNLTQ
jgi:hypothetical protein